MGRVDPSRVGDRETVPARDGVLPTRPVTGRDEVLGRDAPGVGRVLPGRVDADGREEVPRPAAGRGDDENPPPRCAEEGVRSTGRRVELRSITAVRELGPGRVDADGRAEPDGVRADEGERVVGVLAEDGDRVAEGVRDAAGARVADPRVVGAERIVVVGRGERLGDALPALGERGVALGRDEGVERDGLLDRVELDGRLVVERLGDRVPEMPRLDGRDAEGRGEDGRGEDGRDIEGRDDDGRDTLRDPLLDDGRVALRDPERLGGSRC